MWVARNSLKQQLESVSVQSRFCPGITMDWHPSCVPEEKHHNSQAVGWDSGQLNSIRMYPQVAIHLNKKKKVRRKTKGGRTHKRLS